MTGRSEPFKIKPVFTGESSIFTDYYVKVSDVLRGTSVSVGEDINVRIQGGTLANKRVIVDSSPELTIGEEMFLYLVAPQMGSGYNTQGDYYYIVGEHQGAFEVNVDQQTRFSNREERLTDSSGKNFNARSVKSQVKKFSEKHPVNAKVVEDTFLINLKKNLETGFITRAEYKQYLAETKQYAQIIK